MFTIYAKRKPGFPEHLPGWMAVGLGAAVISIWLISFPLWNVMLPSRLLPACSEHLLVGQAGKPLAFVHVVPAMLMGCYRLPLRMTAMSDLEEGLQDTLRDAITLCYK